MQEVSDLYRSIVSGPYQTEVKLVIGSTEYGMDRLVSLSTSRSAFGSETPKLGNAVAREIDLTLYAESENIPRMAELRPYVRVYNTNSNSEWIPKGVYYIDTRQQIQDTITIHGYDAMLLAEAAYPESDLDWPATDIEVVQEIADELGVDIDERTLEIMTQAFPIQLPDQYASTGEETMSDIFTMRDTLAGIAGLYGGVFIFNDVGELQLLCPWGGPEETFYLTDENGNYLTFGDTRILLWRDISYVVKHEEGSVVHVTDAAELPVEDLTVNIELTQSFNGYDKPWAGGAGANILDISTWPTTADGGPNNQNGITITNLYAPPAATYPLRVLCPLLTAGQSYYLYVTNVSGSGNNFIYLRGGSKRWNFGSSVTITQDDLNGGIYVYVTNGSVTPRVLSNMMISRSVLDSYEPYANICPISGRTSANVYIERSYGTAMPVATVSWQSAAGTVYKGNIDFTTGVLTVTHANIASYAGETISTPWLSSMDVYSSGATPTTGAQVVYPLATPFTYQLAATEISTLLGENYIWADTGDVSVDYYSGGA